MEPWPLEGLGRFLEGPAAKDLNWKALRRSLYGPRKAVGRSLEGNWKVHARHTADHFMHAIIEAPGKRRIVLQH